MAQSKADSLERVLATAPLDTNRVNLLIKLAIELKKKDPSKSISYTEQAIGLSKKLNFKRGLARSYHRLGLQYTTQQEYARARQQLAHSIINFKECKDSRGLANAYLNTGKTYVHEHKSDSALTTYFQGMEVAESAKDSSSMGMLYVSIAEVYTGRNNHEKAVFYLEKALECDHATGDPYALSISYGNLGGSYSELGNDNKALEYFFRAGEYSVKAGDPYMTASAQNNIATVYMDMGEYDKAEKSFREALSIFRETGRRDAEIAAMNNIATCNFNSGKYAEAESMLDEALALAKEENNLPRIYEVYKAFTEMNAKRKDYEKAYSYLHKVMDYKDSLSGEEMSDRLLEIEGKYNAEKQAGEIALLTKEKEVSDLRSSRQRNIFYFLSAVLVLVLILGALVYNRYRLKRKANILLTQQKEEVERAHHELHLANRQVSEKNKEITDSINYAKKIQEAILPEKRALASLIHDSFVLYLPKDIVSGDFYWFTQKDEKILVAAADCTGHGVPGAFMSMIGNDKLHHIITENGITSPGEVLKELDKRLISALNQDEASESKDGMDIALLAVDRRSNIVSFAGANRPLYHFRNGLLNEVKGTKLPVAGGMYGDKEFETHTIKAEAGDTFYVFSDGFADQFGGEHGKKLTTSRFKQMMTSMQDMPMEEQLEKLSRSFTEWRGDREQLDDVLVIGIRI